MKCRWLAKIAAIFCAAGLAVAVMSQTVFARDDSLSEDAHAVEQPEATFVILNGDGQSPEPELTDNRLSVPLYIEGERMGECAMVNGEPYMGVGDFFDALGLSIELIDYGSAMSMAGVGIMMTAQTGQAYFMCNDRYLYVQNGVRNLDGAVALPLEALVKCVGVTAYWDRVQWRVSVDSVEVTPLESGERYYNETDLYWLSRLIFAMAENEPLEAKVAVGSVCVNRLGDEAFSGQDNIYEVVFAKNQFDIVTNGMIYSEPDEESILAAKLALEGGDPAGGATYVASGDLGAGYERLAQFGSLQFFSARAA